MGRIPEKLINVCQMYLAVARGGSWFSVAQAELPNRGAVRIGAHAVKFLSTQTFRRTRALVFV